MSTFDFSASGYSNEVNQYNNMFHKVYSQQALLTKFDKYLLLRLSVSKDLPNYNEVLNKYLESATIHNNKILNDFFPDAGFNLFTTEHLGCIPGTTNKIDFGVKCAGTVICDTNRAFPSGFYMYPRSSTGSKTGLRLANSVGIIDSGYRGNLMGVFDSKATENLAPLTSIVQICGPSLVPLWVEIVDELNDETERGTGGFGSTGV